MSTRPNAARPSAKTAAPPRSDAYPGHRGPAGLRRPSPPFEGDSALGAVYRCLPRVPSNTVQHVRNSPAGAELYGPSMSWPDGGDAVARLTTGFIADTQ